MARALPMECPGALAAATPRSGEQQHIRQITAAVFGQLEEDRRLAWTMTIYLCHRYSGCTLQEISLYFGIGEAEIIESSQRFAASLYRDQRLAETVAGLLARLR